MGATNSATADGGPLAGDCDAEDKAAIEDWRWLLWDSDVAREKIHPKLGAAWTAVLKEACCVKTGVDMEKVQRLRNSRWPFLMRLEDLAPLTAPLLRWCAARGLQIQSSRVFYFAALGGDMEAVRWLREISKEHSWDKQSCKGAAEGGHLDVLKYLRKKRCEWDETTCLGAAKGGHLDVLKYARKHGCPWDDRTCTNAAWGGHLDMLKYAHENGCPWDETTCLFAAKGGHLDVLKYAHKNGCPWGVMTCFYAAFGGHLDVLKYAREKRCPWDKNSCLRVAGRQGHTHIISWIRSLDCTAHA